MLEQRKVEHRARMTMMLEPGKHVCQGRYDQLHKDHCNCSVITQAQLSGPCGARASATQADLMGAAMQASKRSLLSGSAIICRAPGPLWSPKLVQPGTGRTGCKADHAGRVRQCCDPELQAAQLCHQHSQVMLSM